jgi:hypothetical protein
MSLRPVRALSFLSLLAACGDRVLPPAEAAASLRWDVSTTGSSTPTCVPGPHWSNAPVSPNDEQLLFSDRIVGATVADGKEGARVRCRVAPRNDKYFVAAEVSSVGVAPSGAPLFTDLVVNVTVGRNERDVQGTLYVTDDRSGFTFSSDTGVVPPKPGCLFSVNPDGELGVAPRRIWARVTCAHIADWRNRDKQECSITEGFFLFDHCAEE